MESRLGKQANDHVMEKVRSAKWSKIHVSILIINDCQPFCKAKSLRPHHDIFAHCKLPWSKQKESDDTADGCVKFHAEQ